MATNGRLVDPELLETELAELEHAFATLDAVDDAHKVGLRLIYREICRLETVRARRTAATEALSPAAASESGR